MNKGRRVARDGGRERAPHRLRGVRGGGGGGDGGGGLRGGGVLDRRMQCMRTLAATWAGRLPITGARHMDARGGGAVPLLTSLSRGSCGPVAAPPAAADHPRGQWVDGRRRECVVLWHSSVYWVVPPAWSPPRGAGVVPTTYGAAATLPRPQRNAPPVCSTSRVARRNESRLHRVGGGAGGRARARTRHRRVWLYRWAQLEGSRGRLLRRWCAHWSRSGESVQYVLYARARHAPSSARACARHGPTTYAQSTNDASLGRGGGCAL